MKNGIHVLVVDDSALVRQVMTSILSQDGVLRVTSAANPIIAFGKIEKDRPDVILLDIEMPQMDGLTFLKKLMAENPLPVVICSGYAERGSEKAMRALEFGAVDIVNKPQVGVQNFLFESAVVISDAVKAAAHVKLRARRCPLMPVEPKLSADAILPPPTKRMAVSPTERVVAIGASTGGTEALQFLLQSMPLDSPGIVIVQHMPEGFTGAFARRLDQICRIEVKEGASGDEVLRGRAIVAPGNQHLLLHRRGGGYGIEITGGPLVSRHRPSVNVLFRSVARAAGPNAVGVIMTGMGDDGAEGLEEMKRAGAATLAQDRASSVVYGMPKAAVDRGAADEVLGLLQLPSAIVRLAGAVGNSARDSSFKQA
jgi:two-component system, chemotaxis family, protein-glutamate methylesterase/glutaminase